MSSYESIIVFKPKLSGEEIDNLISKIEGIITSNNGKIESVNKWGAKKTGFVIKGAREGFYVHIKFDALPEVVSIINRNYRVTDSIVRFLTTKIERKRPKKEKKKNSPEHAVSSLSKNTKENV